MPGQATLPREPVLARGMLFHGLLRKTKCRTMGFTRQRPVQPPMPGNAPAMLQEQAGRAAKQGGRGGADFSVTSSHINGEGERGTL